MEFFYEGAYSDFTGHPLASLSDDRFDGSELYFPSLFLTRPINHSLETIGTKRKNNCRQWTQIVQNTNTISAEFCRDEMPLIAMVPCRCTTPSGELVMDVYTPPTVLPAPTTTPPTASPTTEDEKSGLECFTVNGKIRCVEPEVDVDADCNICGEGNVIGNANGLVEFSYKGDVQSNDCRTWQSLVIDFKNDVVSHNFCLTDLPNYTVGPCECKTPSGDPVDLKDVLPGSSDLEVTRCETVVGDKDCETISNGGPSSGGFYHASLASLLVVLVMTVL